MTLRDLDWAKGRKAVVERGTRVPMRVRHHEGDKPSEEEMFEHILQSIGYDSQASVDIGDPGKRRRFFEYWAKREAEMRKEDVDGSEA